MIMASDKEKQTNQTGRIRTASSVRYMPYVTGAMSRASYWSDKISDSKKLLADREEIAQLNRSILEKSAEMTDMAAWSETGYDREHVKEELADVLVYCRNLLDELDLDEDEIVNSKMDKNEAKYPAELARGSAAKYTELKGRK